MFYNMIHLVVLTILRVYTNIHIDIVLLFKLGLCGTEFGDYSEYIGVVLLKYIFSNLRFTSKLSNIGFLL